MHVDFFIAGGQKCGTTALDTLLRRHPDIQMASQKEPHFFDNEALNWTAPDYARLHAFYAQPGAGRICGEATPIYTYWPQAIERLHIYNPDAKLIIGLRHPALRAFSHWRMEVARDAEYVPFAAAIRDGRERVARAPSGVHRVYSYVERGFYSPQIERVFACFPRRQVLFFRTDKLWSEPQSVLEGIEDFLGIQNVRLTNGAEYITPVRSLPGDIPAADFKFLMTIYSDDIRRTSILARTELEDWLAPGYAEPMANSAL